MVFFLSKFFSGVFFFGSFTRCFVLVLPLIIALAYKSFDFFFWFASVFSVYHLKVIISMSIQKCLLAKTGSFCCRKCFASLRIHFVVIIDIIFDVTLIWINWNSYSSHILQTKCQFAFITKHNFHIHIRRNSQSTAHWFIPLYWNSFEPIPSNKFEWKIDICLNEDERFE